MTEHMTKHMTEQKIGKELLIVVCLLLIFEIILILSLPAHQVFAKDVKKNDQGHIFSTWEGFEPDKCASIWLIQGFIDPQAVIKFFPKGDSLDKGIPFDTPDAKFRRYAKMSTFESLVNHYKLTDAKLIYIGRIIHDIEINIWERKIMPETFAVRESITKIITESKDKKHIIEKGNIFFDTLYKELNLTSHSKK